MGSVMAYFCRLYISSGALTPDSMLCDLFGLKVLFLKSNVCKCVCMCKPSSARRHHLCVPSPEGLKPSCHGDGTQVLQWLPRRLWCHGGTGTGNSSAANSPRVENYLILASTLLWVKTLLQQISGSPIHAILLSLFHNGPFTAHCRPAGWV